MDISSLSGRDRSMYWAGTHVLHKETGEVYYVQDYQDGYFSVSKVGNNYVDSSRIRASTFESSFYIHRFPLGWRNVKSGCIFGSHHPGRGNRKSYTSRDVLLYSPIQSLIRDLSIRLKSADDVSLESLDMWSAFAQNHNYLEPTHRRYFGDYHTAMLDKYEAVTEIISGNRVGAAIDPKWAVVFNPNNYKDTASVYYNTREVGTVSPDGEPVGDWINNMSTAWSRV